MASLLLNQAAIFSRQLLKHPLTMKLLFDFLPLILFFAAFKLYDIWVATGVIMVATLAQVAYSKLRHKKVEKMHLWVLGVVIVLGGLTLLFGDERFLKWKPTIVNWAFAVVFLGSQFIGERSITERIMGGQIQVPGSVWTRVNLMWVAFFVLSGVANLYVAYSYSTEIWVDFKVFGLLGATFVFVILQALYLARYVESDPQESEDQSSGNS